MHYLLSLTLRLHSSSFTVIPVRLNGSRGVEINSSADESFVVVIPFLISTCMLIVHNMITYTLIQAN